MKIHSTYGNRETMKQPFNAEKGSTMHNVTFTCPKIRVTVDFVGSRQPGLVA
jgi:hypothetical protein